MTAPTVYGPLSARCRFLARPLGARPPTWRGPPGLLDWTPKVRHSRELHFAGKGKLRVEKRKVNKYPIAFRKMALERLKTCQSATELSAELGIHRTLLYKWRDRIEPFEDGPGPAANSGERELRKQIRELKRVLGEKVLEADFFKGALQKVEARRQNSGSSGGTVSSSKSGS
jgi:transposase